MAYLPKPPKKSQHVQRRVKTGTTGLNTRYRFDNFVLGKSNELGYAAASQIAQKPGDAYNPLLLYGSTGLGKTHLLHAIGNMIREQNRSPRCFTLIPSVLSAT